MHATGTTDEQRRAVRSTYRSLRLAVVALPLLLVTAVATEAARAGCWLDSLSAYYWTGAHDAVVGALCAVGAVLVVYTGVDDVEDALLDAAGFLALVVALPPTEPGTGCPGAGDLPAALADVRTSLTALCVAGIVAFGVRAASAVRTGLTPGGVLTHVAGGLVVLVLAATLLVAPDVVVTRAHDLAAVLLFVAVVGVVVRHAFDGRGVAGRWAVAYAVVGASMFVALAAVVAVRTAVPAWGQAVLVLETALVGLFAAFWVLQTVELWGVDVPRRRRTSRT